LAVRALRRAAKTDSGYESKNRWHSSTDLRSKNRIFSLDKHGPVGVAGKWFRFVIFDVFGHFVIQRNTFFSILRTLKSERLSRLLAAFDTHTYRGRWFHLLKGAA
jgi:hypothetical protein